MILTPGTMGTLLGETWGLMTSRISYLFDNQNKTLQSLASATYHSHQSDILRYRKAAGHLDVVVVSTQEKIISKVEVLFFAMAFDPVWKLRAQPVPNLITTMARFR